ncbi:hypothetical protein OsJ_10854 [Oryza sativa Japonica Group]|nr:hypothetical protein OsJ_10854 [Oryza sativa Japonica Group]
MARLCPSAARLSKNADVPKDLQRQPLVDIVDHCFLRFFGGREALSHETKVVSTLKYEADEADKKGLHLLGEEE